MINIGANVVDDVVDEWLLETWIFPIFKGRFKVLLNCANDVAFILWQREAVVFTWVKKIGTVKTETKKPWGIQEPWLNLQFKQSKCHVVYQYSLSNESNPYLYSIQGINNGRVYDFRSLWFDAYGLFTSFHRDNPGHFVQCCERCCIASIGKWVFKCLTSRKLNGLVPCKSLELDELEVSLSWCKSTSESSCFPKKTCLKL